MRTATHIAVEETTAKDYIELGVNSIEHFYGVADAALNGIQNFPPDMSYSNEIHRFGRAGELYAQADPEKLHKIIDLMVEKHVAWDPTFSIYEASRDLVRAQSQPWFKDYLHPSMEEYFKGSLDNHGSYFLGWTTTQEAKLEAAVPHLDGRGPRVREQGRPGHHRRRCRLHLFDVRLRHLARAGAARGGRLPAARGHRARDLERREAARAWRIGSARSAKASSPISLVVNGNPLENLKLLNPYGADVMMLNGRPASNYSPLGPTDKVQSARGGGIEWTIKDGIPYHVPTLMREVKEMVSRARAPARPQHDRWRRP